MRMINMYIFMKIKNKKNVKRVNTHNNKKRFGWNANMKDGYNSGTAFYINFVKLLTIFFVLTNRN